MRGGGLFTTAGATRCLPGRRPVSVGHYSRTGLLQQAARAPTPIDTHRALFSLSPKPPSFSVSAVNSSAYLMASSHYIEPCHTNDINENKIQELNAARSRECRSHQLFSTPKPRPVNTSLVAPTSPSRSAEVLGAELPCAVYGARWA